MSTKDTIAGLHSIRVELDSQDRAALCAVGPNGNRYHVWITTEEPLRRQDGWLYCNPPEGVDFRQPGYFNTRQYPLNSRYTGMDAIVDKMMEVANREGLLGKARAAYAAKRAAEAEDLRARARDLRIREAAPAMFAALNALLKWEKQTGGWDAPAWKLARAAVAQISQQG